MTITKAVRRAARITAAPALLLLAVGVATPAAATPASWQDPEPMPVLEALLIYAGIPLGLMAIITLLVVTPSLIRGDHDRRGVASWTEPEWFGGPGELSGSTRPARPELDAAAGTEQTGGASARW